MKHRLAVLASELIAASALAAQSAHTIPFNQGVNLTGWLQEPRVGTILPSLYTETDFQNIKRLGCDVVRLPVNLGRIARSAGGKIPPRLLEILDRAVQWSSRNGICLILDNHTQEQDSMLAPDFAAALPVLWAQMAEHFKGAPSTVIYEIFNEPHDIDGKVWERTQRAALASIRKIDKDRLVVVTGADWGGIDGLVKLTPIDDPRLLYSFHFYDPMIFTHQGAGWVGQETLAGVPFPPDPKRKPTIGDCPHKTRIEADLRAYASGDPVGAMRAQMDKARDWAARNGVAVFCGEMGVHNETAIPEDRARWYGYVSGLLAGRGIPFMSWDYRGSFGLFKRGSYESFGHDLDLSIVESLGLRAQPQSPGTVGPERGGFPIYTDEVASGVTLDVYENGGAVDLLSTAAPKTGSYCLRVSGLKRYGSINFVFRPAKDLSRLAQDGAALRLWVRGNQPKSSLEIRFVDSTGASVGRPWRRSFTLDSSSVPLDGAWRELTVPLSGFAETGAWDGAWHEPEGLFDWARVGRLEIVAEAADLGSAEFSFNGITIGFAELGEAARLPDRNPDPPPSAI